jgi:hypothetical protein
MVLLFPPLVRSECTPPYRYYVVGLLMLYMDMRIKGYPWLVPYCLYLGSLINIVLDPDGLRTGTRGDAWRRAVRDATLQRQIRGRNWNKREVILKKKKKNVLIELFCFSLQHSFCLLFSWSCCHNYFHFLYLICLLRVTFWTALLHVSPLVPDRCSSRS